MVKRKSARSKKSAKVKSQISKDVPINNELNADNQNTITTPNEILPVTNDNIHTPKLGNQKYVEQIKLVSTIFNNAHLELSNHISYICSLNEGNNDCSPDMSEALTKIKSDVKNHFRILKMAFHELQETYTEIIKDKDTFAQELTLKPNNISNSDTISTSSQTEIHFNYRNQSTITDETSNINKLVESAVQTDVCNNQEEIKSHSKQIHLSNCNSLHKNATMDTKFLKLKIEEVPVNLKTKDICQAIHNINNDPFSSITFVRRYRLQLVNRFNYVFQLPEKTAVQLIFNQGIIINSIFFSIKPFIDVIRCFICQRLGHCSNRCVNTIACAVCAGSHSTTNCKQQPFCVNCSYNNKIGNTLFDVRHPSYSKHCKSIKYYIDQHRQALRILHHKL